MSKRIKILISAYACNPLLGSEEGVGWGFSEIASVNHEVWVITDKKHQQNIEQYLLENPNDNLLFEYLEKTEFFKFTEKYFRLLPLLAWRAYFCWQKDAYKLGEKLHNKHKFDYIHNLTYVGFRAPGYWHKMRVPFVWGPLGGLEQTNLRLAWVLGFKCFLWFFIRNILNWRDKVLSLRVRRGMKNASTRIISATPKIAEEIKRLYNEDSFVISEVGVEAIEEDFIPCKREKNEPIKLLWIGRMYPGKGFDFVLQALAKLDKSLEWQLEVFGDGECRKKWEKKANKMGFNSQILWRGNRVRTEVLEAQKNSHALIISSIYELTGTIAVEALCAGLVAIAPDICGFAESVPDNCGIRFKADTPKEFVNGLKNGIEEIYFDEEKRVSFSENANKQALKFAWNKKIEMLDKVYK